MEICPFVRLLDWRTLQAADCLTARQSREVDRFAIEELGISSLVLMENAARSVCDWFSQYDQASSGGETSFVVRIVCGRGNNGGDGFAIARLLWTMGYAVEIFATHPEAELSPDARVNAALARKLGIPWRELQEFGEAAASAQAEDWIVDAILGTGQSRPLSGVLAELVQGMNVSASRRLAVDLPTGFSADAGPVSGNRLIDQPHELAGLCVRADVTITFVTPKMGMLHPGARAYLGETFVASIGLPEKLLREAVSLQ